MRFDSYDGHPAAFASVGEPAYYPRFPVGATSRQEARSRRRRKAELQAAFAVPESRGLMSPSILKTGYVASRPRLDAALNRGLAAVCLVVASPLFLLIMLGQRVVNGWLRIERGFHFGKGVRSVAARGHSPVANADHALDHDALLQLISILKGDMVFFGPHPEWSFDGSNGSRASAIGHCGSHRPGMVSLPRIALPPDAEPRMVKRVDAMCRRAPIRYRVVFSLLARSAWRLACVRLLGNETARWSRLPGFRDPKTGLSAPEETRIRFSDDNAARDARVSALSDQVVQFATRFPPDLSAREVTVSRTLKTGRDVKLRARLEIKAVYPVGPGLSGYLCHATFSVPRAYLRHRLARFFLSRTLLSV